MRITEKNKEILNNYDHCLKVDEEMAIMSAVYPSIMSFLVDNKNKSPLYYFAETMKTKNTRRVFEKCVDITMSFIFKELFSLEKESFESVGGLLSETALAKDKEFQNIRAQLPQEEMKNINNRELFKKIRESFVHNSPEDPNLLIDKDGKFHIRIKLKDGKGIFINASGRAIFHLIHRFTENQAEEGKYYYEVEGINILNHMESDGIDENNVFSFVRIFHDGQKENLDTYQKRTISRFINHRINCCRDENDFMYFMGKSFTRHAPYRGNADNLFMDKIKILQILMEVKKNPNITKKQILNIINFKSKETQDAQNDLLELQVDPYAYIIFPIISSTMFTIFSDMTNDELLDFLTQNGIEIELEQVRRLRNSLIHGRYYYNQNRGIEFYDGRKVKELEHKFTISTEKMIEMISAMAKNVDLNFKTEY